MKIEMFITFSHAPKDHQTSTDKENAHLTGNGFSQVLESRFLVPKNEAQCA